MRVKTDQLPVGSRLSHPINDGEDRLLLAAGVLLSARIKERLLARGIREVLLHPDDAAALLGISKPPTPSADPKPAPKKKAVQREQKSQQSALRETVAQIKIQASALASSVSRQIVNAGPPLSQRQVSHGTKPYDAKQRTRLAQHFSVTSQLIDKIAHQAVAGKVQDDRLLKMAAENYIGEIVADTDSVLASACELAPNPALTEQGVRLALLGMAMAIEMDWDEVNVREVGLCGLVHEFGMFRLDERLHDPQVPITDDDWNQMVDHPLLTLDMLTSMKNVSLAVRLAATQVHENPDGSGYPRGLKKEEIHPYATLLHAADAYITLTAELRGRRAYLSYDVMVYLLNQVKANRMDEKAMRALLQVISLFPIGSHVRLSDGTEAQVIRRNEAHYTAPIVQRVGADRKARFDSAHASIIDLAETKMRIMSPLVPPDREETRLDEMLMGEVLWEGGG
ncbi:MAG: HD domain-containing protein [Planctomycetes bacterium]|nr:HD domain-containing protein [Planctomycetota bacterium]